MNMDENLLNRLKLSRILHGIGMEVEEILSQKTSEEQDEIRDAMIELVRKGCAAYMNLMEDERGEDFEDGDVMEQFLLTPHGIPLVDALSFAISNNKGFTPLQEGLFFASLAEMLLWEIPDELQYGISENDEFKVTDPVRLIEMSVFATNAMCAMNEAKRRVSLDSIPDHAISAKVAEVISEKAKRNAELAHVEHRAMKATVFEWCDANFSKFKSIDQAAQAIAGVEVPVAFTTARSWIREWKQKNTAKAEASPGEFQAIK